MFNFNYMLVICITFTVENIYLGKIHIYEEKSSEIGFVILRFALSLSSKSQRESMKDIHINHTGIYIPSVLARAERSHCGLAAFG